MTSTRVIPKSLGNCHPWLHRLAKAECLAAAVEWMAPRSNRGTEAWHYQKWAGKWLVKPVSVCPRNAQQTCHSSHGHWQPQQQKKHTGPKCEATAAAVAAIWFQHSHSNIWMQKGCCSPPGPENGVPYWTTCESPGAKTAQRPKWAG